MNMKNMMRWLGRLENNYRDLRPNPVQFLTIKGSLARVPAFLTDMDGIRFYCMEDVKRGNSDVLVVMVENIKLQVPVLIDPTKHTDGKRVGPRGCAFGDSSARNLLIDIADNNDDQREAISQIYEKYFGTRRMDDRKTEHNNASQDSPYLPTREDFENTRRKFLKEGKKRISIDDMLDIIEGDVKRAGKKLAANWRSVTEKNIESWSRKGES
jgi:hypothetical protein